MLSILNALSFPIFKNFSVVSGHKSLNKAITRTAIFEWESLEDIKKTFQKGDFVITSLVTAKNDPAYAEECIKTLINLEVSCIAIKDIYIKEIPEHLCVLSNLKHVPIIIFAGTYYDDIIFAIKQELLANDLSSSKTVLINSLLNVNLDSEHIVSLSREINPFFYENIICCYSLFSSLSRKNNLDHYYQSYFSKLADLNIDTNEFVFSIIEHKDGIFIIFSYRDKTINVYQQFFDFLTELGCLANGSKNGISSAGSHPDHLKDVMKESIYAAISCKIDNATFKYFSKIGIDQLLIPSANEYGARRFYEKCYNILYSYDKANNMNFLETLLVYVQSACDIDVTSKKLFQHRNTIRYRINKIKLLLELDNLNDADLQLYLFIRLHLINQLEYLLPYTGSA